MVELETIIRDMGRRILDEMGESRFNDPIVHSGIPDAPIGAYITLNDRQIHIATSDEFVPKATLFLQAKFPNKSLIDFLDPLLYFIMGHEFDHHKLCPKDQELQNLFVEGVYESLHGRIRSEEEAVQMTLFICNMLEDTILNTINARTDPQKERYKEGFANFYRLASFNPNNGFMNDLMMRMNKGMALFSESQNALLGINKTDADAIRKKYPLLFLGFPRYTRKLITIFTGDEELTEQLIDRSADEKGIERLLGRMQDTSLWKGFAHEYATLIYPFITEPNRMLDNSFTRPPYPSPQQSGQNKQQGKQQGQSGSSQNQGKETGQSTPENKQQEGGVQGQTDEGKPYQSGQPKDQSDGEKEDKKDTQGSGREDDNKNDRETEDKKDSKDKKGKKKDKKDEKKEQGTQGRDESADIDDDQLARWQYEQYYPIIKRELQISYKESPFLQEFFRLDQLYRRRAGRIRLSGEVEKQQGDLYEQMLSKEEMPIEEFESRNIDWSSTQVRKNDDGSIDVQLYRKANPITLPFEGESTSGGLPDLAFVFDSSGSMMFNPVAGQGEYHLAVLAFYSILNDLEDKGVAPLLNYQTMNFSDATKSSGWVSYADIGKAKRTLFDYQGSGTVLDPNALAQMRLSRKDNFMLFLLSDFCFNFQTNEQEVTHELEAMLQTGGIGIFLFQIGHETDFSKAMQEKGAYVKVIKSVEDFLYSSYHITQDLYAEEAKK